MIEQEMNTCCYKAMKHGELVCPVCGLRLQRLISTQISQYTH